MAIAVLREHLIGAGTIHTGRIGAVDDNLVIWREERKGFFWYDAGD
jgi:hypothetical protein